MLLPMGVMVFYIWIMAISVFLIRKNDITKNRGALKYFKIYSVADGKPNDRSILVGQHYDNLMQLPLLFLITCAVCLALKISDMKLVYLAWAFIISRLMHTYIHLGSNHILKRAATFALGWFIVIIMWLLILSGWERTV
jgi:hypothetical protein